MALRLGAELCARFPDGQFYVDLRDASGGLGPEPATVLLHLLRQMGIASERMPPTASGREQIYRQMTAGRRDLVVVDHAYDERLRPGRLHHLVQVRGEGSQDADRLAYVAVDGRYTDAELGSQLGTGFTAPQVGQNQEGLTPGRKAPPPCADLPPSSGSCPARYCKVRLDRSIEDG